MAVAAEKVRPEFQEVIKQNPEMEKLLATIRKIAQEKFLPYSREFDRIGGAQAKIQMPQEYMAFWTAIRDAKLLVPPMPKKYGGLGLNFAEWGTAIAEGVMAGQSLDVGFAMCSGLQYSHMAQLEEGLKAKYMKRVLDGGIPAIFHTEARAGLDLGGFEVTGQKDGDSYILNGQKWWVAYADPGPFGLNFAFTTVKTNPEKGVRGLSVFLIDNDTPGIYLGRPGDQLGIRFMPRWEVSYKNCRVPASNMVGKEGDGARLVRKAVTNVNESLCFQATSLSQSCLDYTMNYTKKREAFGSVLAEFPGIYYVLADMIVATEGGWALSYKSASYKDRGLPETDSLVNVASIYTRKLVSEVTSSCMSIFCGRAFERGEGHPIERMWRDAAYFPLTRGQNLDRRFVAEDYLGIKLRVGVHY